mmetsp:Transcript_27319/g.74736  ORF Transcript_27319/g.74736 Transcript_27319/m.74736 type:complete len:143 (-) Transcript_27319:376-804(-)
MHVLRTPIRYIRYRIGLQTQNATIHTVALLYSQSVLYAVELRVGLAATCKLDATASLRCSRNRNGPNQSKHIVDAIYHTEYNLDTRFSLRSPRNPYGIELRKSMMMRLIVGVRSSKVNPLRFELDDGTNIYLGKSMPHLGRS